MNNRESGNAAALGYAMQSGIPYGTAFIKNGYVGRTFIKPKQSSRESAEAALMVNIPSIRPPEISEANMNNKDEKPRNK